MRLAGIISCCGFFSNIFGVLFGSEFGFEDIIDAVWLRPQEAMTELPAPTHAFIGGSSGNMLDIINLLLEKNPKVRIVINCITLETVTEAKNDISDFGL